MLAAADPKSRLPAGSGSPVSSVLAEHLLWIVGAALLLVGGLMLVFWLRHRPAKSRTRSTRHGSRSSRRRRNPTLAELDGLPPARPPSTEPPPRHAGQ
jgi:hypothetical protein